jgi:hypothetical protein
MHENRGYLRKNYRAGIFEIFISPPGKKYLPRRIQFIDKISRILIPFLRRGKNTFTGSIFPLKKGPPEMLFRTCNAYW